MGGIITIMLFSCAGLGCYVACEKGRAAPEGALLGLLFGPLGVIVVALLPDQKRASRLAIAAAILVVSIPILRVTVSRFEDPYASERATYERVMRTLGGR